MAPSSPVRLGLHLDPLPPMDAGGCRRPGPLDAVDGAFRLFTGPQPLALQAGRQVTGRPARTGRYRWMS